MKDNLSLVAAAAGGFMLSVALAGILRGTPLPSWQAQANLHSSSMTYVSQVTVEPSKISQKKN
ncbi:hypothetical protein QUB80_04515 [Chlorogloeopsis sp. ULAP01]|uniref:hypothetical protein n=1 Tax=Chlorogloeopsis sp. ULAP01 TaxID=3056483 RepID=UPI0025AA44EC|nr:hypothetical protein [Chlorogloeopsis sp. ULAP01]MDM9379961.1 hypothetical protein [Chlorogloeopsis sp. ULAP01]